MRRERCRGRRKEGAVYPGTQRLSAPSSRESQKKNAHSIEMSLAFGLLKRRCPSPSDSKRIGRRTGHTLEVNWQESFQWWLKQIAMTHRRSWLPLLSFTEESLHGKTIDMFRFKNLGRCKIRQWHVRYPSPQTLCRALQRLWPFLGKGHAWQENLLRDVRLLGACQDTCLHTRLFRGLPRSSGAARRSWWRSSRRGSGQGVVCKQALVVSWYSMWATHLNTKVALQKICAAFEAKAEALYWQVSSFTNKKWGKKHRSRPLHARRTAVEPVCADRNGSNMEGPGIDEVRWHRRSASRHMWKPKDAMIPWLLGRQRSEHADATGDIFCVGKEQFSSRNPVPVEKFYWRKEIYWRRFTEKNTEFWLDVTFLNIHFSSKTRQK